VSDEKTPIADLEAFDGLYETLKAKVLEIFDEDKKLDHTFLVVKKDGFVEMIDFDKWVSMAEGFVGDEDRSKEVIYKTFARGITGLGAIGFIEFFEAWTIRAHMEEGESHEQTQERMAEIRKKYGQIKDVPTRVEVVLINGRFKDTAYMSQWKINRRDDEVWLSPIDERKEKDDAGYDGGRQGCLHKAVMENVRAQTA
jgi:hypothetical protein